MLAENALVDLIHERVSAKALQLPVFHHVALKLMNVLAKEDYIDLKKKIFWHLSKQGKSSCQYTKLDLGYGWM
jgi:hypothetical protein